MMLATMLTVVFTKSHHATILCLHHILLHVRQSPTNMRRYPLLTYSTTYQLFFSDLRRRSPLENHTKRKDGCHRCGYNIGHHTHGLRHFRHPLPTSAPPPPSDKSGKEFALKPHEQQCHRAEDGDA
jgi:hypothetical protein